MTCTDYTRFLADPTPFSANERVAIIQHAGTCPKCLELAFAKLSETLELEGLRKANTLLTAGLESTCEVLDGYKREARELKAESERLKTDYLVLKDAIWHVPGEVANDDKYSQMTHEETRRMAVDQAIAFEENDALRAENERLTRDHQEMKESLEAYKEATGIVQTVGYVDGLNAAICTLDKECEENHIEIESLTGERDTLRRVAGELYAALLELSDWQQSKPNVSHRSLIDISATVDAALASAAPVLNPPAEANL